MDDELKHQMQGAWLRFVDEVEPLRGVLFKYCLRLTGNPFDAEDLVAEGMLRTFGSLGYTHDDIDNLKAYLLRVVSRLWIDELRRARPEPLEPADEPVAPDRAETGAELSRAAAHMYRELSPLQRAAVVLRDVFDLSHREIASILSTTEANAKVTLHRARKALLELQPRTPRASRETVERFVEAFLSYDVDTITQLLVDDLEASVFPSGTGVGLERHIEDGWLRGSFYHHVESRELSRTPYPLELRVEEILGDVVVLVFRSHGRADGRALEELWLLEESDGRVARITDYCFCPDLVRWVGDHVGEPSRGVGYRYRDGIYDDLA